LLAAAKSLGTDRRKRKENKIWISTIHGIIPAAAANIMMIAVSITAAAITAIAATAITEAISGYRSSQLHSWADFSAEGIIITNAGKCKKQKRREKYV